MEPNLSIEDQNREEIVHLVEQHFPGHDVRHEVEARSGTFFIYVYTRSGERVRIIPISSREWEDFHEPCYRAFVLKKIREAATTRSPSS
jgi:hypothetical protein